MVDLVNNPFNEYLIKMKMKGVDISKPHWLSNEKEYSEVANFWKDMGALPVGFTLKKLCRIKGCLNPAHFKPVPIVEEGCNFQDIEELMDYIDTKEAKILGLKKYTDKFNFNNPLPVTERDMAKALNLKLLKEKEKEFFQCTK